MPNWDTMSPEEVRLWEAYQRSQHDRLMSKLQSQPRQSYSEDRGRRQFKEHLDSTKGTNVGAAVMETAGNALHKPAEWTQDLIGAMLSVHPQDLAESTIRLDDKNRDDYYEQLKVRANRDAVDELANPLNYIGAAALEKGLPKLGKGISQAEKLDDAERMVRNPAKVVNEAPEHIGPEFDPDVRKLTDTGHGITPEQADTAIRGYRERGAENAMVNAHTDYLDRLEVAELGLWDETSLGTRYEFPDQDAYNRYVAELVHQNHHQDPANFLWDANAQQRDRRWNNWISDNVLKDQVSDDAVLKWLQPDPFYSRTRRALENTQQKNFKNSQSLVGQLRKYPEGVPKEELQAFGMLEEGNFPASKEDLLSRIGGMDDHPILKSDLGDVYRSYAPPHPHEYFETGLHLNPAVRKNGPWGPDSYTGSHFNVNDLIAHYRHGDWDVIPQGATDPVRAHLGVEFQSDWHQRGRKSGYRDDIEVRDLGPNIKQAGNYLVQLDDQGRVMRAGRADGNPDLNEAIDYLRQYGFNPVYPGEPAIPLEKFINAFVPGVEPGPLRDDWLSVAMRHYLRDAVDSELSYGGFPTGETIKNLSGGQLEGQKKFYEDLVPKVAESELSRFVPNSNKKSFKLELQPGYTDNPDGGLGRYRFNLFSLPPDIRRAILEKGMPLWSILGMEAMDGEANH